MYNCPKCQSPVNLDKAARRYAKQKNMPLTTAAKEAVLLCACGTTLWFSQNFNELRVL